MARFPRGSLVVPILEFHVANTGKDSLQIVRWIRFWRGKQFQQKRGKPPAFYCCFLLDEGFQCRGKFSKLPRAFTHDHRLQDEFDLAFRIAHRDEICLLHDDPARKFCASGILINLIE